MTSKLLLRKERILPLRDGKTTLHAFPATSMTIPGVFILLSLGDVLVLAIASSTPGTNLRLTRSPIFIL